MRNGKLHCPVCGENTRDENFLVCFVCHKKYVQEASESLVQGTVITLSEWVLPRAETLTQNLRQKLSGKRAELDALKKSVSEDTYTAIKKATAGQYVHKDVFEAALARKRKDLWQERGGNRLFAEVKTLEETITAIEEIVHSIRERNNKYNHTPTPNADPDPEDPDLKEIDSEEGKTES